MTMLTVVLHACVTSKEHALNWCSTFRVKTLSPPELRCVVLGRNFTDMGIFLRQAVEYRCGSTDKCKNARRASEGLRLVNLIGH